MTKLLKLNHFFYKWRPIQKRQKLCSFSDQEGAKTLPDGAAHTYIAYIGEYPQVSSPGVGGYSWDFLVRMCHPVLQILTHF